MKEKSQRMKPGPPPKIPELGAGVVRSVRLPAALWTEIDDLCYFKNITKADFFLEMCKNNTEIRCLKAFRQVKIKNIMTGEDRIIILKNTNKS